MQKPDFVDYSNLECVKEDKFPGCLIIDYSNERCKQCDWDNKYVGDKDGNCTPE
jgi:hypothetical protein